MAIKLLPRFYSTQGLPEKSGLVPISPQMVGRPFEAMSQAGEKIEGLGLRAANVFDQIKERERIASDALQAVELDNSLKNESLAIADKFKDRVDYENFDKDIENEINSLKQRVSPKEPSQALNLAFKKTFNQEAFHLRTTIKAKKYDVMNQRGKIAFGQILDRAYQDYSDTNDPTKREIIKNELEIQGEILRGKHLIDPIWIDEKLRTFEKSAKTVASDLADVKADRAIMADPAQAHINLLDSRYLPDLLPKQRQDKIEKALAAFKIFQNEQDKKLKEQQKAKHDNEDRQVGDLFMKGEYTQAYSLAQQSKFLTGDEKRTWAISIENASKVKEEKIDPSVEAAEIVMINDLISKNIDPRVIRNSVVITPRLSGGNREQYLNKLETKLNTEITDGRRQGYQDIKDIIFPPARGLSIESLIQTPQQTTAIVRAQMSLDEWIDRQVKAEKYPSKNEIRNKSFELANTYNPSIQSRIEFIEEKAKKQAEEIRKIKEKKK